MVVIRVDPGSLVPKPLTLNSPPLSLVFCGRRALSQRSGKASRLAPIPGVREGPGKGVWSRFCPSRHVKPLASLGRGCLILGQVSPHPPQARALPDVNSKFCLNVAGAPSLASHVSQTHSLSPHPRCRRASCWQQDVTQGAGWNHERAEVKGSHANFFCFGEKCPARYSSAHGPERDESLEGPFGPDRPQAQTRKSYGHAFS